MRILGYAWLRETLSLPVLPVSPLAPGVDTVLTHGYFALKQEGTNLGVLSGIIWLKLGEWLVVRG
jgi:hypothetical protein